MIARSVVPAPWSAPARARCSSSSSVRISRSVRPSTPFIGVRISWLIVARNCDFICEASMAWSRASASSAAARSRSATRPSMRRDLLDEVAGVLVGRHLVGEHHHHAGHAGAVADRDARPGCGSSRGRRAGRTTISPVRWHSAASSGSATMPWGGRSRVSTSGTSSESSRSGRNAQSASQPGVLLTASARAQQGLDQPGGLVGHHRDLPQQRQAPGGLADLVVGEHLVGDVLVGAGHPHRPAGGVALGAAEATQPADGAVAPDDPGVPLELVGAGVRRVDLAPDVGPVVGVDVVEEPLVGGGELLAGDLVDPVELVGPHDLVVLDVPLPAADGGDRLRLGQPLLAVAQRVEQLPALGVVGVAVEVAEDVAGVVAYRPPARQQPDRLAVGAQVHRLEVVVAGVAGARHGHVGGELLLAGGVVDVVRRQPGHLLGGPAQQLGHPLVGPQRAALAVQQPDAVGAGLDQVPEQPRVRAHGHHHRLCARLPQRLRGAGPTGRRRAAPDGVRPCACSGGQGRGRTADLSIFSRSLVPTELPGRSEGNLTGGPGGARKRAQPIAGPRSAAPMLCGQSCPHRLAAQDPALSRR